MRLLKTFTIIFILPICTFAQHQISNEIKSLKLNQKSFTKINLFEHNNNRSFDNVIDKEVLSVGSLFNLNQQSVADLKKQANPTMELTIPQAGRSALKVELMLHSIFTPDFKLFSATSPKVPVDYEGGLHYRGIIKGDSKSMVAISIFDDEVMGLISSSDGSKVLGKLEGSRDNTHILYNENDLKVQNNFSCGTADDDFFQYKEKDLIAPNNAARAAGDCVRIYVEIDNDIVNDKGGVTAATNYITGLFNQSFIIYANDGYEMSLSEILAWDTTSPYSSNSSSGMLNDFQAATGSFNGNLAHLVSYQASGGIAAGFSGICNSNPDNSKCFSSIISDYSNVPTYSWSVMVVTHEMGHLCGSRHTHACVWNNNNTAIDGCSGSTEGGCSLPGNPTEGGTIMSYCHITGVGINLSLGFGPQPQAVILNVLANASCTSSCGPPTCTDGFQNGDEAGVDCGGPDCPACPTCDDGILNGDEAEIDCGGPDCPVCPCDDNAAQLVINLDNYPEETSWEITDDGGSVVAFGGTYGSEPDGSQLIIDLCLLDGCYDFTIDDAYGDGICCAYGVGDYTLTDVDGNILAYGAEFGSSETTYFCLSGGEPKPTCDDDILNGDETDIDCGGPDCPACPTCNDGIQNGDETDVDCGGPDCPNCPTCKDGIQNGNETGVDCGGPDCPDCPSCKDGIQNGDETGVDCGGPDCPDCPTEGCRYETINFNNFDSGFGIWNDGGSDCRRNWKDQAYANSGIHCIRLRDNTNSSTLTTDALNLNEYNELTVTFSYITKSMDNANEDFWLQVSTNNGASFTTVEEWNLGDEFVNNVREDGSAVISGPFSSNTMLRFRCDASGNFDWVYIDDVEIIGCVNKASLPEKASPEISKTEKANTLNNSIEVKLYPNPANDFIKLEFNAVVKAIQIINSNGQMVKQLHTVVNGQNLQIDELNAGLYFMVITDGETQVVKRFVKL